MKVCQRRAFTERLQWGRGHFFHWFTQKSAINQKFTERLQLHGKFPIKKKMTLKDTGLCRCVYKITERNYAVKTTRSSGSVLLVVTGEPHSFIYSSRETFWAEHIPPDLFFVQRPSRISTQGLTRKYKYCRGCHCVSSNEFHFSKSTSIKQTSVKKNEDLWVFFGFLWSAILWKCMPTSWFLRFMHISHTYVI